MGEEPAERAAATREWLEGVIARSLSLSESGDAVWRGVFFGALFISGLRVSSCGTGRVLCIFRVPPYLADREGNWQPGAIATVIDIVGAAVIMTTEGVIKVSVDFAIDFFSHAKIDEEVEIDARATQSKGMLTAMRVEIWKRGCRKLVAVGRQWTIAGRPLGIIGSSKL